jgi:hypothetical protein
MLEWYTGRGRRAGGSGKPPRAGDGMRGWVAVGAMVIIPVVANAECSWVLWSEDYWYSISYPTATADVRGGSDKSTSKEETTWSIVTAEPTNDACKRHQEAKIGDMLRMWRKEAAEYGYSTVDHQEGTNLISKKSKFVNENTSHVLNILKYLCLPDTIDPRGQKR